MKKLFKIAILVIITGCIAAALTWKFYINKPHEDIDTATPAFMMSTQEIWKQFSDNIKSADSLYSGKVIVLSGNLSRIEKNDTLVSIIFVMAADSLFGNKTISCQMYQKHNGETSALLPGTPVKVKGLCSGYNDPDIKFNKCSLLK
jgi:hypothetical protein